jgi:pimeloyl-ACP methyl ester carboxylesterase
MMFRLALVLAATLLVTAPVRAQTPDRPVSVVLVHGAFVDGSGWRQVHDRLSTAGYEVLVVQISTATLEGDVATTRAAIARARHPVVLVGHSYGGTVITEAGGDPKVRSLVYIAAFVPDVGESVESMIATPVPGAPALPVSPLQDGYIILDPEAFPAAFAGDVDAATARFMAASQTPYGQPARAGVITRAAWKAKPSFYVLTTNDLIVPPVAQRQMAGRAGATVTEVASSHAAMVSHPAAVVAVIEAAAASPR